MRRIVQRLVLAAVLLPAAAHDRTGSDDSANLESVEASFHTTDYDKDYDARLSVYVYRNRTTLVAASKDNEGHYAENTDHTLTLGINGTHTKDQMSSCTTLLTFAPNGHEPWDFDYKLKLTYADGSVTKKFYKGERMSIDQSAIALDCAPSPATG